MGDLKVLKPQAEVAHETLLSDVEEWVGDRRKSDHKLAALAIVSVHSDGSIGTMYQNGDKFWALLGAMHALEWRMHRDIEDDA